eukprot:10629736-Alexandrium_andersonii.AAC.1
MRRAGSTVSAPRWRGSKFATRTPGMRESATAPRRKKSEQPGGPPLTLNGSGFPMANPTPSSTHW